MGWSKFSSLVLFTLVLVAVVIRFEQYVVEKNFIVLGSLPCADSDTGCFLPVCEDSNECEFQPYKKMRIKAAQTPSCLYEHNCEAFSCTSENDCELIVCSDTTLEEGETCKDQ